MDLSVWFPDNIGLREGCVMSSWLFNVMRWCDGLLREMNIMMLGKKLELPRANGMEI